MSILYSPINLSPVFSDIEIFSTPVGLTPILPNIPLVSKVTVNYSKPTYTYYEDINYDPKVQRQLTSHYYYKTLDKWLYDDLLDVLNYFVYSNGQISLIKNLSEYDPKRIHKESNEIVDKKVEYIEKNLLDKNYMHKILKKYVKETNTEWVYLPKNEFFLKQAIEKELIKRIKQSIGK